MVTIGQSAKEYEPQQFKNIADLEVVRTNLEIKDEVRQDREGKDYKVSFITVDGEEYRVPVSVLEQLKKVLEAKPELTSFKVSKSGEGMNTKYQVISL